jgi:dihydropteroate synthase
LSKILDCKGKPLDLSRPQVMGVLNVTPDSFSDGGEFFSVDKGVAQAQRMVEEGAAIIDIGGESTRPGAQPVSLDEELRRVLPVIEALQSTIPVPVSIDTQKPEVMRAAVAAGAGLINDIAALQAEGAIATAAELGVPVCLMHMQGIPETMQDNPGYTDVVGEVAGFLATRADACIAAGIPAGRILIDPGFGFGKTVEHNLQLLRQLDRLVSQGYPVLVGLSRKSLIGKVLDLPVDNRLYPGIALAVLAAWQGAAVIRTHDVQETVEAVRMCVAVRQV